jgi:hypothetical protein
MIFADHGYPNMATSYTINQDRLRSIVARALKCSPADVNIEGDDENGHEATIITEDPYASGRTEDMFKRWAKADAKEASDPKAN